MAGRALPFPLAVVGASAGGLEAFKRLLSVLPARAGMSFILIPHLDPGRESHMVELLAGTSAMPVRAADNGRRIRPDHVYVIPPNRLLAVHAGRLVLSPLPHPRAAGTALDHALKSVAEDQGRNAVGIVLSGTGTHGASGLKAILRAGGLGLAQDPATAQFDQMPRSAAEAGVAPHHVLAPESMAEVLLAHARQIAVGEMTPRAIASPVTGFFHDAGALDTLAAEAIPSLIERATADRPVRVWIPECATGEEAYSIAMLLLERLQAAGKDEALKVFATDADPQSLRVARLGIYPDSLTGTLSRERLARFFDRVTLRQYKVTSALRQTLVFGLQHLATDPPISRIDLLVWRPSGGSARNGPSSRLLSRLHFALNPGGYLLLGSTARMEVTTDLFAAVSRKWRLYCKAGPVSQPRPRELAIVVRRDEVRKRIARRRAPPKSVAEFMDHALLESLAPAHVAALNEGLRSANEELQSSNEEMRAINAELESAKSHLQERTATSERIEAQLSAVLDATADAVVTVNADGKIVTFNGSASRMFGYALHEVIGRSVTMLLPPELRVHQDAYLARDRKARKQPVIGTSREVIAYRRDGSRFPALLSVSETAGGDLLVGCLRDLTQDKALQEEILHIAALEQQRIGQELHDGTQQELTGLGLLAQSLSEELRQSGSAKAKLAERLAAGLDEANRHVRALAHGLVPIPVDAETLPAALGDLARTTRETHKLDCRLDCPNPVRMPDAGTATHLYRIAQEAVGNAVKHSKADNVLIRLAKADNQLRLEIHDNGVGIPPQPRTNGGVGLRLMEHRCTVIGGRFGIRPREGGGTVICCTVPWPGPP